MIASPESKPAAAPMTAPKEAILIAGAERTQVSRLQRELRTSGYRLLAAVGAEEAGALLSREAVQLAITIAHYSTPVLERQTLAPEESPPHPLQTGPPRREEGYALCHAVKSAAEPRGVPVLLMGSVWARDIVTRALETGADYFLFAPYQGEDLMRAMHVALLNGPSAEPAQVLPGVEVVHQYRRLTVTAGRSRLAWLSLAMWEQLRQSLAALSWSQAEVQELRHQLRQERQQAQQVRMIPEVVQGIAHDFANLIETISAAATVLRSDPAEPARYRAAMDAALAQASTLVAALQNRDQWGSDAAAAEPVDAAEIVENVVEAALLPLRAPNIRVRLQVQDLPPLWTNPALLSRSLGNLVRNAVQAMPSGGLLSILGYVHKNRVVLEVHDTGVGIAERDQSSIFEPQFSTKPGHAGLGLHLVRSLVRRGGGDITFASRAGHGSTFAVSFPVAQDESAAAKSARRARRSTVAPP